MIKPITTPGKTYAVTSPNGCTVTQHVGEVDIVTDVPAGLQTLIIAHASRFEIDDDSAIVTECGGSAELVFTAATTRAASSGTGSDGMTAEERALLLGAAQRDGDNTFSAGNTFTGAVDMSGAQVTPPEGWNVGNLTPEAIQAVVPIDCSNDSVTLGTGASSGGKTNAVVIGKGAETTQGSAVIIGANAKSVNWDTTHCVVIGFYAKAETGGSSVAIGYAALVRNYQGVAIGVSSVSSGGEAAAVGNYAKATGGLSVAFGRYSQAAAAQSVAIGANAKAADQGAVVFRSTAEDGTITQLYFSGANTPLATTYENGEAMMGYMTTDAAGNIMTDAEGNAMVGTQKLSALFPNNRGENAFTPAILSMDDEWTPKPMFRPSDLDMPDIEIEEPTEPEMQEYQPLPVYPIVEPEIPEMEEV